MNKKLISVVVGLIILASVQILINRDKTEQKEALEIPSAGAAAAVGGAFTLTDQNGKTVHDTDFKGRIMLVSFGFTHCPDICPITVSTLSQTLGLLGDKADAVAALFISVDSKRDTPAVMKDFLSNFDTHLLGLTGSEEQIKQVADAYKVYYAQSVQNSEGGNKENDSIDHSGYIYMMAQDGRFLRVFPYDVSDQELASSIETALR